jgi:RNA recognition motif-containing protein
MSGRPRGFAFVEFENDGDAEKAIETLNGRDLAGRELRVDEARERAPRLPREPSGGGFDPGGGGGGGRPFKAKGSRRGIRGRKRGF